MESLFLTEVELFELTAYKYAAKQIAWLKNNGYKFEVNSKGRPKLLKQHLIAKLSDRPRQTRPNWEALKR